MDDRRSIARRTGSERRSGERRSYTAHRPTALPISGPERRKDLRRREHRRSLITRRRV